jgi:shikimate kinase
MTVSEHGAVVVLIGAPGAGKTRTGKRVARLLTVPLVDTDKRIVAEHGPIADIFATYGEPYFRSLERAAVAQALTENAVVTLGGGAVLDPDTQRDLEGHRVVQLTVSADAVAERIEGGKRPLLKDGVGAWSALVAARQPIYDRLSQLTIDTSNVPLDGVAQTIADWLGTEDA